MARQTDPVVVRLDDPIGRKSVSELVVQRILDMVKAGSLAPGHKLPAERDLAQQLDVSRPTVREALRALAILGVVEIRHGGGVYVTSLDAELLSPMDFFVTLSASNMAELFDARIQFEPMITRMAAERLTDCLLYTSDAADDM
jgi:GntR family transcriptional repressor for pyruvate dehydrogenase complex